MTPFRLGIQEAKAFNQPLSLETSSVTDMNGMFKVRSTHALPRLTPSFSAHMRPLFLMTFLRFDSAQEASAFNQLLSLDTSSVTDMSSMFSVRSTPMPYRALNTSFLSPHAALFPI